MFQKFAMIAVLAIGCTDVAAQRNDPTRDRQLAEMGKLQQLIGRWEGTGYIEMGSRRFDFKSSEVFSSKAGGLAIVVEGLHTMPSDEKRVVHDAVALINFDVETGKYRFISQLANGRSGNYEAVLTQDGDFQWTIPDTPVGKMVYTITFEESSYSEVGEIVSQAGERHKFFEMTLKRIDDGS